MSSTIKQLGVENGYRKVKPILKERALLELYSDILEMSKGQIYAKLALENSWTRGAWYLQHMGANVFLPILKLRLRNTHMRTETGIWFDNLETSKLCFHCLVPDDELHMILVCPRYEKERNKYISAAYRVNQTIDSLTDLLNSHSKKHLNNLAKYLNAVEAKKRQDYEREKVLRQRQGAYVTSDDLILATLDLS